MITFSGSTSLQDILAVARDREQVEIAPEILARVEHAFHEASALSDRYPTYGRGTGFGANTTQAVDAEDMDHGMRLLRSSAIDAGVPLPPDVVRAMLAVRLSQLTTPGAGLDPAILPALATMLNANALPTVGEYGSIGTGDLAALCGAALTLIGERPASAALTPMSPWRADSALPFVSSNALTIGRAVLAADELRTTFLAATATFALSFSGLVGNPSALSDAVAAGSGMPQSLPLARRLRALLGATPTPRRIQDPYGLRAFLQSTVGFVDALGRLEELLSGLIGAAQENPLFVFDESDAGVAVDHNGNFLQAPLGLALDAVKLALAQMIPLNISRLRMMSDPAYTGLAPFLTVGPPSSSGIMMVEYVASSAYAAIHTAAAPNSLATVVLSRGVEDDASFASEGVSQLERASRAYRTVVGAELLVATRLLRQRSTDALGSQALTDVFRLASATNDGHDDSDHDQRDELAKLEDLLPTIAEIAELGTQIG